MQTKYFSVKKYLVLTLCLFGTQSFSFTQNSHSKDSLNPRHMVIHIPMADGIPLTTDIYLPKGHKKYPAVLVRTPYDKSAEQWMGKPFGMFGIAVVVQDVRGRYSSPGEYYPFIHERNDGLQTLRWIRKQPWSNGKVAGWGASYVGFTQWAIADSLDLITPLLTGANLYDFLYPDGLFSLHSAFTWGLQNESQVATNIPAEKLGIAFNILPLSAADDSTVRNIPFLNDWMKHETDDAYWHAMSYRGKTNASVLSLAGWYDIFLEAQINDFKALDSNAGTRNRLIIGPWCHGPQAEVNEYGGLKKTGNPSKVFKYVVRELKGKPNKLTSPLKDRKYNLFIMERNEYVGSDVWPPAETKSTPYFIGPSNYLKPEVIQQNGDLKYTYSPADPFPSHGGTILGTAVGPARQNESINRKDQLSFETIEINNPMILLGPVSATLWLSSNVLCTDFIVGLEDVFPDGKIINIQEGGAKVTFSGVSPQKTEISIWATGYQLNPGHKLRVIITSSWFPRFNRNLNSCQSIFEAKDIRNANQTVFYGPETPSSINLPIYTLNKK